MHHDFPKTPSLLYIRKNHDNNEDLCNKFQAARRLLFTNANAFSLRMRRDQLSGTGALL
jgi:hypothetical protein